MRNAPKTKPPFPRYELHYCQEMRDRWQSLPMNEARHKDSVEKGTKWYKCPGCGEKWEVGRG